MEQIILAIMASKGGVGKSALARMFHKELTRQGYKVNGKDGDTQQHFNAYMSTQPSFENPDVTIVDTQGAWTSDNESLIHHIKNDNYKIIVPFKPSDEDLKEALLMAQRLKKMDALNNAVFVVNETYRDFDAEAKSFCDRLREHGLIVSKWQFQDLRAIQRGQNTGKAQKQVQRFLHEQGITHARY